MTLSLRDRRALLARESGRRKLDAIVNDPDPAALVRSLPAQDLYFAIAEIGVADSAPLVQLATPAQFRTFVDLDAWRGAELDPGRLATWLSLARGDDEEAYGSKLSGLDLEVIELLLRSSVRIYDLEEEEDPGDVEGTVDRSPDGRWLLHYPEDGVEYADARRLIFDLYDRDAFLATRMLSAVRSELESELTETALRWRSARLADLGFPPPEEAASLYARVPLSAPAAEPAEPPDEPPGFFLTALERGSLLDRAAARLDDEARDRFGRELVAVMNMAIVADAVDVSELSAVRDAAQAVRDTIALGLGRLAQGDEERAAQVLAGTALKRVFQVGFTRTLELRWRLDRLLKELPLRLPGGPVLAELHDEELANALLLRRPRFGGGGSVRPFAEERDLAEVEAALDRIEELGRALQAWGMVPEDVAAHVVRAQGEAARAYVRGTDLLATALAREAAGLAREPVPLPVGSLAAALGAMFEGSKLTQSFRGRAVKWLPAALAERVLGRIENELGPQRAAGGPTARTALPLIVEG